MSAHPFQNNNPTAPHNDDELVGSLESLGINVETEIDPSVLAPGAAKSIHFRVSKPSGYSFEEVDDFVTNIVVPSIEWYAQVLYQRDRAVHLLGTELDRTIVDNRNLKSQLQFATYNNQITQGVQLNNDDQEVNALLERIDALTKELETLKTAQETNADTEANTGAGISSDREKELTDHIQAITNQYQELVDQYTNDTGMLQQEIERLQNSTTAVTASESDNPATLIPENNAELVEASQTRITELEEYIAAITKQYEELLAMYEASVANQSETAQPSASMVDAETYNQVVTENEILNRRNTELVEAIQALQAQLGIEDDPAEPVAPPRLKLSTEERAEETAPFDNGTKLPPGIRPDDLM